jgi:membrane protein involved in D-alanine export
MIPYTDFLYFGISLYALLPGIVLSLVRRFWRAWLVISTTLMLIVQYYVSLKQGGSPLGGILLIIGYALYQWVLASTSLYFRKQGGGRGVFYLSLGLALLPLIAAKWASAADVEYPLVFLGLSYVTFRCVDVLIGIHDGVIKEIRPFRYLTFMLFFPTVSSGPIDRYRRFSDDWAKERKPEEVVRDIDVGIHQVFTGFLYKFILATLIKQYWMDPVSHIRDFPHIASYMYAYTFYLFFDFAGYSTFAIGFSYLLGIHTPANFNRPFLSRDIRDFWNRWHMSLSFWFRDHIYNRFLFNAIKGKWFKNSQLASSVGYVLTMSLMGLWHGTSPNYLVYGLYHGGLLAATAGLDRAYRGNQLLNDPGLGWQAASIILTFHLIAFGLLIFSGHLF